MKRSLCLVGLLFACACGESLDPASLVTSLRAVAARVEVEGDAERPNPLPGEVVTVTIRVIDQGPRPDIQWRFVACVPEATLFNVPICGLIIEPCDNCEGDGGPEVDPVIRFQVPDEAELGDQTQVLLQGAICADGPAAPLEEFLAFAAGETGQFSPCDDPALEGTVLIAPVVLQQFDPPNRQPQIADVLYEEESVAWVEPNPPASDPISPCDGDITIDQTTPSIRLSVTPDSLVPFVADDEEQEDEIQVSWLGDAGEFDRSFSFIDESSPVDANGNLFVEVDWELPMSARDNGTLVRFNFVVRNTRGGQDWTERALCVFPPATR